MNTLAKVNPDTIPTAVQLRALRAFHKLTQKLGRCPTQREFGAELGLSENGAQGLTRRLVERGLLTEPEIVKKQSITPAGLKWVKP
jgi:hypothetical protein